MSFSLVPDLVLESYAKLTAERLKKLQISLLLCDLDFTLAPRSVPEPDGALRQWLEMCRAAGVTVVIMTNNRSTRRVERFCAGLGIDYVGHAGKPGRRSFLSVMERTGIPPEHTAMLGDKLLTDVLGAKRSGVLALMVEPAGGPVGIWNHVLHLLQRPFKAIAKRRR